MNDPIHADPYTRLAYWQERAQRAEATNTRLREALEAIANSRDAVVNIDGEEIQPRWRRGRLYGSPRLYARDFLRTLDAEQENA